MKLLVRLPCCAWAPLSFLFDTACFRTLNPIQVDGRVFPLRAWRKSVVFVSRCAFCSFFKAAPHKSNRGYLTHSHGLRCQFPARSAFKQERQAPLSVSAMSSVRCLHMFSCGRERHLSNVSLELSTEQRSGSTALERLLKHALVIKGPLWVFCPVCCSLPAPFQNWRTQNDEQSNRIISISHVCQSQDCLRKIQSASGATSATGRPCLALLQGTYSTEKHRVNSIWPPTALCCTVANFPRSVH